MTWINIPISFPFGDEFRGCEPVDRATWFMLNAFCHLQENGGVIRDSRSWSDRKWQQVTAVTREEVMAECALWHWEGEDLHVRHYPADKESLVKAKREYGRVGGRAKSEAKREAVRKNGSKGGRPSKAAGDEKPKQKPKQKPNGRIKVSSNSNSKSNMDARESKHIDGVALEKAIRDYCDASGKKYTSEALKSAVRQIQAGSTGPAELIAKLAEISKTARRNKFKDKRFLMSLDSLIELEGWKSPLDTWLVGDNPELATEANQTECPVRAYGTKR